MSGNESTTDGFKESLEDLNAHVVDLDEQLRAAESKVSSLEHELADTKLAHIAAADKATALEVIIVMKNEQLERDHERLCGLIAWLGYYHAKLKGLQSALSAVTVLSCDIDMNFEDFRKKPPMVGTPIALSDQTERISGTAAEAEPVR